MRNKRKSSSNHHVAVGHLMIKSGGAVTNFREIPPKCPPHFFNDFFRFLARALAPRQKLEKMPSFTAKPATHSAEPATHSAKISLTFCEFLRKFGRISTKIPAEWVAGSAEWVAGSAVKLDIFSDFWRGAGRPRQKSKKML